MANKPGLNILHVSLHSQGVFSLLMNLQDDTIQLVVLCIES